MAIIQNLEAFVQSYPVGLDSVTDLQLSQNENGRQIRFTIGGVTIPAGSVATISGTKPDGVVYSNTGTIEGSDTVIFDEDVQMTAVFGTWYAKIRITNAGNTIASARVRFIIDKDPVDAGAIPSESQLNGLVAEAEEYAGAAEDAAERAAITYGSPLTAATASAMTDINRVYVYTGSESGYTYGNWYYYNGSAWVSGGVYNSAAVETDTTLTESGVPADAKATGDKIAELKDDLAQIVPGLSDEAKQALLVCFDHVAWANDDGQDYYDALEDALYPNEYPKITVSFVQGNHTVYAGTSVDTLKPYLTVTYYTDASTSRVLSASEYALSGLLVAGSNFVTVSYGGLTRRFNVTAEMSGLPSGYTPYDYIRVKPTNEIDRSAYNSYSGGQFAISGQVNNAILTTKTFSDLFALNYHFKAKTDRQILSLSSGYLPFLGGRIVNDEKSLAIYRKGDSLGFSVHCHGSNLQFTHTFDSDNVYDYRLVNPSESPSKIYINDSVFDIPWSNNNVVNYVIGLFTNRTSNATDAYVNNAHMLGVLEITDRQNNLVAKYIPVKRDDDNIVGIYDVVSQEFKTAGNVRYTTQGNTYCIYGVGNWS